MIDILVILDRSGSMEDAKSDHEGGLKSFVKDQADLDGDVRFTEVQFDSKDPCEILYDRVPIREVGEITLIPRGGTPLLDAIGRAVSHLEAKQIAEPSDYTVCMIITDGHENASTEWTTARVKARIADLEKKRWKFIFLGADIDAFGEAGQIGMAMGGVASFSNASAASVGATYAVTSAKMSRSRGIRAMAGAQGMSMTTAYAAIEDSLNYTEAERSDMLNGTTNTVTVGGSDAVVSGSGDSESDEKAEG